MSIDGHGHSGHGPSDVEIGMPHGVSDTVIGHVPHGFSPSDVDIGHLDPVHAHSPSDAHIVAISHMDPLGWFGSHNYDVVEICGHHIAPSSGFGGASPETNGASGSKLSKRADPNRRSYGLQGIGHGLIDVPAKFMQIALKLNMVEAAPAKSSSFSGLLDLSGRFPLEPAADVGEVQLRAPAGYFPGASGRTYVWTQFWQVGTRNGTWPCMGKPQYDWTKKTTVFVRAIVWEFALGDCHDYETRFEMYIVSKPVWGNGTWCFMVPPFREHQGACQKIVAGLSSVLDGAKPQPEAVAYRKQLMAACLAKV